MNAITNVKAVQWVLNNDGATYRCAGLAQYPEDKDEQKKRGLIASASRSIHGRTVKTGNPA